MGFFADHGSDGRVQKWRLYFLDFVFPTSVALPVGAGSHTVTPASMYGITVGKVLAVSDNLVSLVATAPSPATTGTTMVLTTGDDVKLPPTPFYAKVWDSAALPVAPFVEIVQVTNVNTLTHVLTIVRAGSPRAIVVGDSFAPCLVGGGSTGESVTVTGITANTFTATFANGHAGGWLVSVPVPAYWTDCDIDITTSGAPAGTHTWAAKPILAGQVSRQPDGASASFQIGDADGDLFPLLAANNGGELAVAAIYEAGFLDSNKTPTPDEVLEIFSGRVDRCTANTAGQDIIEIVLMPPVTQNAATLPTRLVASLVRVT